MSKAYKKIKEKSEVEKSNLKVILENYSGNLLNSNEKQQIKSEGITLIALVLTIVILIILSTITINFAFGENGLVRSAESARDFYANDTKYTEESVTNVTAYLNGVLSESNTGGGVIPEEQTATTVAEAKLNGLKYKDTTTIDDDLLNDVVIPGGFHLAADSATKVEDGIVIEDDLGNQFVWIPTGTYQTTDGEKTNELTRRQWETTENSVQEPTPITGDEVISGYRGAYYYGEGNTSSVAYGEIDEFLASAKPVSEGGNGGFYIGRYEQGTGNVCKAGVDAYVNVTRDEAKAQAEAMYSGNSEIKATSQLISSYAWDTALNFICQTNTEGYVLATTTDDAYGNIDTQNKKHTGEYPADCYSNIYDFLGNCFEWTTEYSSTMDSGYSYPCVIRGGRYDGSNGYAAYRNGSTTDLFSSRHSFRISLYVK